MLEGLQVRSTSVVADDWDSLLPKTDHALFFQSRDWSETRLGPLKGWCLELRLYTLQAFADTRPVCIYWGSSRVAIYNAPFILLAGGTHPALMGARFEDIYPEICDAIFPIFAEAEATRTASAVVDLPLLVERNGFFEESFFDGNFVPLILHDGAVGGFFNNVKEITTRKLSDRRTKMFNLLSTSKDQLTSVTVYAHITSSLSTNRLDVPFALLWRVDAESEDGNHELVHLDGLGLPGSFALHQRTRLRDSTGFMPLLYAARRKITSIPFDKQLEGVEWENVTWGGHGKQSQVLTVIPLASGERLFGFLLVGNNPLRPVDDDYNQFMANLQNFATSAVAATISADEAMQRNHHLQAQLVENERRIRYMAQHSDIGMIQLGLDGSLVWANEHYHFVVDRKDTGRPRQTFIEEAQLLEKDRIHARKAWQQVLQGEKAYTTELRLKRQYQPPFGDCCPATIILSAFPYIESGQVKSVMACMTEVSRLKWAESWQAQVAQTAKEDRKRQSEFTDAISHEVRNPLSAILQLADSIVGSTLDLHDPTTSDLRKCLEENVEAAKVILKCARHQKRIVDDVLSLSRMDYASLASSPVATWPGEPVQEALQLVEADATASSVSLQQVQEQSFRRHPVQRVMCDSLRIVQILVNLLSNAIKFTKDEKTRVITITHGIALAEPRKAFSPQIAWTDLREGWEDPTLKKEWGDGESLWLTYSVRDTGPGMTREQLDRVFDRFEQANLKTSTKYGGSGLGLFISHNLTKRQGGEMGAASTEGQGTTFAFYIKARRAVVPQDPVADRSLILSTDNNKPSKNNNVTATILPLRTQHTKQSTQPQSKPHAWHILLVEDNIINQQILRKQLQKAGCTVHVANHGIEALDFLRKSVFWTPNNGSGIHLDVILMDWEMPVMDGLTCTREIRSMETAGRFTKHLEILAVTANVRPEQVDLARVAGMDGVVPKPFVVSELLETIARRMAR